MANLSNIIEKLCAYWELTDITPVANMTYNYVAKAVTPSNQHVVLKIGVDKESIIAEQRTLIHFDGNASIKLLDYNEKYNALLLQQAIPGTTLKSLYPHQADFVMDCYVATVQKLLNKVISAQHEFQHISNWLQAIDQCDSEKMPKFLLNKSIQLKQELLASLTHQVVLHGDLHHDNILKHGDQWLAIDPKGIIGEVEFEIAAFDFIHHTDLENKSAVKDLFASRVELIAKKANLNAQRIKDWVFVRIILAAAWSIEDHSDAREDIALAELLF